jgi:putative heme-binding domain-containing protein
MLVPGFTVRELPVRLTNLNGLAYAPDGRLFALGYDGRIHVLRDTDGDGLEDRAEVFWDRPTLRTPTALAWRPEGLYVVSNGKVSLFPEAAAGSGDPRRAQAAREEVVVQGWVHDDGTTGGGVDAVGLAFDREGSLYFGIGCADYSNAYRVHEGKAHYDRHSERGTIVRVSPDRKHREVVCTGVRFSYGLAFNRHGDLFSTDQEGETWLPGGNPLDELNHILPGRHYGFPPRHEKYLPDVYDEPPVIAFGPQHQSSCGIKFNEALPGRPRFGPAPWEGDALVAGFSRGKLWRARLMKTPRGYVGRPEVIAALGMLTLDLAISPAGDLVVCCHGGLPDWGTGPSGAGRIFKISYTGRELPQPVAAWTAGPLETRVAFDRPVDPNWLDPGGATITFGEPVRAGDRFEVLRPGYESVQAQQRAYRGALRVAKASLSADRRTLLLATDPHPMRATYALTLPLRGGNAIDLGYDLTGVEAVWTPEAGGDGRFTTWLPHLDLDVARGFTAGSAEHERLGALLKKPGRLRLHTRLELPDKQVLPLLVSEAPLQLECAGAVVVEINGGSLAWVTGEAASRGKPIDLAVTLRTGKPTGLPRLHVSYHTANDPTERPLPTAWQFVPWAPAALPPAPAPSAAPELAGGDWRRGEALFFGAEANCSACHQVRGRGSKIGPDLSNLVSRDAASVLRDIIDPNATLNPDYVPYTAVLSDGRILSGLVRAEGGDRIRLVDGNLREMVIDKRDIEQLSAGTVSIMPQGYADLLGPAGLRDLLVFLTAPTPETAAAQPPVRSRAEVDAVLRGATDAPAGKPRPLHIVLVAGPKDHGPGEHDYPAWQRRWEELLGKAPDVRVETASEWPGRELWQTADVVVFYFWNHDWGAARLTELDAYLARGGGLVALHSAVIHDKDPEALAQRLGLAAQPSRTKYRHGPLELKTAGRSPITRGLGTVRYVDESYWPMIGEVSRVEVLATTVEEGKPQPMVWTYRPGKGRVFCSILGHYAWTFDDPLNRVFVLRGMAWAAGEPLDRFTPLVTEGLTLR